MERKKQDTQPAPPFNFSTYWIKMDFKWIVKGEALVCSADVTLLMLHFFFFYQQENLFGFFLLIPIRPQTLMRCQIKKKKWSPYIVLHLISSHISV